MNELEQAKSHFLTALDAFKSDDLATAELHLRQALALAPDRVSILTNLAAVLLRLDRPEEARPLADRSVELDPDNAEGWLNVGGIHHARREFDRALDCYDRALALDPGYAEAWSNRGQTLNETRRHAEALDCMNRALELNRGSVDAWIGLGNILHALDRHDESVTAFDKALAIRPASAQASMFRGMSLAVMGRLNEALQAYDLAIRHKPDYPEAWSNRGNALHDLGRPQEALESYARALALRPDYAQAHFNEACCRLALGDFATAWPKYVRRRHTENAAPVEIPELPEWDGQLLPGKLLVRGEQGLGDQILNLCMLREARTRCAGLILAVEPRLVSLVQRSFPDCQVMAVNQPLPLSECSAWISLSDLGQFFRLRAEDFSANRTPWLVADSKRIAELRQELHPERRLRCGISWVSKNNRFATQKSLELENLLELFRLDDIEFVDLQYGDTAAERERLQRQHGIAIHHLKNLDLTNDLEGLAGLIRNCDMVVSISNTTAHFAGALGIPMYLMLPFGQGRHWYWHHNRTDSPWYPTATLYRQTAPPRWSDVVHRVVQDIRMQFHLTQQTDRGTRP